MIETIQTIIADLNSNTAINNILGWRISIWQPINTPTEIYLTITIISETQNIDVNKIDRIEFRFLWWNENTSLADLNNIETLVKKFLYANYQKYCIKLNNANYYQGYTDLKIPFLLRDYIFYTLTDY